MNLAQQILEEERKHKQRLLAQEPEAQIGQNVAKTPVEDPTESTLAAILEKGTKSIARGAIDTLTAPIDLADWFARQAGSTARTIGKAAGVNIGSTPVEDLTSFLQKKRDDITGSDPLKKSERGQKGLAEGITDPVWYAENIGETIPYMAAGRAFTKAVTGKGLTKFAEILRDPKATQAAKEAAKKTIRSTTEKATAGFYSATGAGQAHADYVRWERENPDKVNAASDIIATTFGAAAGSLEGLGVEVPGVNAFVASLMKQKGLKKATKEVIEEGFNGFTRFMSEWAKTAPKDFLREAGQEGAQTLVENIGAKLGYQPDKNLTDGILESMWLGGVMGGGMSGFDAFNVSRDASLKYEGGKLGRAYDRTKITSQEIDSLKKQQSEIDQSTEKGKIQFRDLELKINKAEKKLEKQNADLESAIKEDKGDFGQHYRTQQELRANDEKKVAAVAERDKYAPDSREWKAWDARVADLEGRDIQVDDEDYDVYDLYGPKGSKELQKARTRLSTAEEYYAELVAAKEEATKSGDIKAIDNAEKNLSGYEKILKERRKEYSDIFKAETKPKEADIRKPRESFLKTAIDMQDVIRATNDGSMTLDYFNANNLGELFVGHSQTRQEILKKLTLRNRTDDQRMRDVESGADTGEEDMDIQLPEDIANIEMSPEGKVVIKDISKATDEHLIDTLKQNMLVDYTNKLEEVNRAIKAQESIINPGKNTKAQLEANKKIRTALQAKVDFASGVNTTPKLITSKLLRERLAHATNERDRIKLEEKLADQEQLEKVSNVLGVRVVRYSSKSMSDKGITSPTLNDVIFINEDLRDPDNGKIVPAVYILGHEFGHHLKNNNPELWNDLRDHVLSRADMSQKAAYMKKSGARNRYQFEKELVSDYIGSQFTSNKFWDDMYKDSPTKFQKILTSLKKFINVVLNKLGVANIGYEGREGIILDKGMEWAKLRNKLVEVTSKYLGDTSAADFLMNKESIDPPTDEEIKAGASDNSVNFSVYDTGFNRKHGTFLLVGTSNDPQDQVRLYLKEDASGVTVQLTDIFPYGQSSSETQDIQPKPPIPDLVDSLIQYSEQSGRPLIINDVGNNGRFWSRSYFEKSESGAVVPDAEFSLLSNKAYYIPGQRELVKIRNQKRDVQNKLNDLLNMSKEDIKNYDKIAKGLERELNDHEFNERMVITNMVGADRDVKTQILSSEVTNFEYFGTFNGKLSRSAALVADALGMRSEAERDAKSSALGSSMESQVRALINDKVGNSSIFIAWLRSSIKKATEAGNTDKVSDFQNKLDKALADRDRIISSLTSLTTQDKYTKKLYDLKTKNDNALDNARSNGDSEEKISELERLARIYDSKLSEAQSRNRMSLSYIVNNSIKDAMSMKHSPITNSDISPYDRVREVYKLHSSIEGLKSDLSTTDENITDATLGYQIAVKRALGLPRSASEYSVQELDGLISKADNDVRTAHEMKVQYHKMLEDYLGKKAELKKSGGDISTLDSAKKKLDDLGSRILDHDKGMHEYWPRYNPAFAEYSYSTLDHLTKKLQEEVDDLASANFVKGALDRHIDNKNRIENEIKIKQSMYNASLKGMPNAAASTKEQIDNINEYEKASEALSNIVDRIQLADTQILSMEAEKEKLTKEGLLFNEKNINKIDEKLKEKYELRNKLIGQEIYYLNRKNNLFIGGNVSEISHMKRENGSDVPLRVDRISVENSNAKTDFQKSFEAAVKDAWNKGVTNLKDFYFEVAHLDRGNVEVTKEEREAIINDAVSMFLAGPGSFDPNRGPVMLGDKSIRSSTSRTSPHKGVGIKPYKASGAQIDLDNGSLGVPVSIVREGQKGIQYVRDRMPLELDKLFQEHIGDPLDAVSSYLSDNADRGATEYEAIQALFYDQPWIRDRFYMKNGEWHIGIIPRSDVWEQLERDSDSSINTEINVLPVGEDGSVENDDWRIKVYHDTLLADPETSIEHLFVDYEKDTEKKFNTPLPDEDIDEEFERNNIDKLLSIPYEVVADTFYTKTEDGKYRPVVPLFLEPKDIDMDLYSRENGEMVQVPKEDSRAMIYKGSRVHKQLDRFGISWRFIDDSITRSFVMRNLDMTFAYLEAYDARVSKSPLRLSAEEENKIVNRRREYLMWNGFSVYSPGIWGFYTGLTGHREGFYDTPVEQVNENFVKSSSAEVSERIYNAIIDRLIHGRMGDGKRYPLTFPTAGSRQYTINKLYDEISNGFNRDEVDFLEIPVSEEDAKDPHTHVQEVLENNMPDTVGFFKKLKDDTVDFFFKLFKDFSAPLPSIRGVEHAQLNDLLRQFKEANRYGNLVAYHHVYNLVGKMTASEKQVFTMNIVLRNMLYDYYEGNLKVIPFGYKNIVEVKRSLKHFERVANQTQIISKALELRRAGMQQVRQEMADRGLLDEKALRNESFFHQMSMDWINRTRKSESKIDEDPWSTFEHESAYGLNFLTAEHTMMSNAVSAVVKTDLRRRIKSEVDKSNDINVVRTDENGNKIIAPGYVKFSPIQNGLGQSVQHPQQVLDHIWNMVDIDDDVRAEMFEAAERERETWVVSKDVAEALRKRYQQERNRATSEVENTARKFTSVWKKWQLINPFRFIKYNINNMSGDLDIAMAYDPRIIKGFKQAFRDVLSDTKASGQEIFGNIPFSKFISGRTKNAGVIDFASEMTDELRTELDEAYKLGVLSSGFIVNEVENLEEEMSAMFSGHGMNPAKGFWNKAQRTTNVRENILRLATWRYFKQRLQAGEQYVYGASNPGEIDAITNINEKAAKLARELIGDYGNISNAGNWMRSNLIPFYSWLEINAPRYVRMMRNAKNEGRGTGKVAKMLSTKTAYTATKFGAKFMMFSAMVWLWNQTLSVFGDDEEENLPEELKRQMHIVLGTRDDGTIRYLPIGGAFRDTLSWFGGEDAHYDYKDLVDGRKDIGTVVVEAGSAFKNKIVYGAAPFVRMALNFDTGVYKMPNMDDSLQPIKSKFDFIAQQMAVEVFTRHGVRALSGIPSVPVRKGFVGDFMEKLLWKNVDPNEQAYYTMRKKANTFMEDMGTPDPQVIDKSDINNARYWLKKSLRYGDLVSAEKWMKRYYELGGTVRGIKNSFKLAAPTGGLGKRERKLFYASLGEADKKLLDTASKWYKITYGKSVEEIRDLHSFE